MSWRSPSLRWAALPALVIAWAGAWAGACTSQDAVTLPATWNTLKARRIAIAPHDELPPPRAIVRPLNGIDGAPRPIHPGLPDLRVPYGRASAASDGRDGARVDLVRVGPDTLCGLSLDEIYRSDRGDPGDPSAYDFTALDAQVDSVIALGSATLAWGAGFAAGGPCEPPGAVSRAGAPQRGALPPPLDAPDLWASVVANVARHLVAGDTWDPGGRRAPLSVVEIFGTPEAIVAGDKDRLGPLFDAWIQAARAVRAALPEAPEVAVSIAGPSFEIDAPDPLEDDDPTSPTADRPPSLRFIDACAEAAAPLDVLSVRARVSQPYEVRRIAAALRAYLDAAGLTNTELLVAAMAPRDPTPFGVQDLDSAYLGAFETAARVFLQDVPARWALSGRGPWSFRDRAAHAGQPLADVTDLLTPSAYFTLDGTPRPSFMARLPLRQIGGQQRVRVEFGADHEGVAILASHPTGTTRILSVLIADADVAAGVASVTYDLRIPRFVPPAVRRVDFRVAVLDQRNEGLQSFFFSEVGSLEPSAATGDVRLVRTLPVPGVHYIEFEQPLAR